LETLKIKAELFSDELTAELTSKYQATLKKASEDLLDLTIQACLNADAKLRQEADQIIEDVKTYAMQKWMDAQHFGALGQLPLNA
jgi:hypothetical protein